MASRLEAETHLWHDHFSNTIYVESTRRGVWAKCERIGMALDLRSKRMRRYTGGGALFGISFRRRSRKKVGT